MGTGYLSAFYIWQRRYPCCQNRQSENIKCINVILLCLKLKQRSVKLFPLNIWLYVIDCNACYTLMLTGSKLTCYTDLCLYQIWWVFVAQCGFGWVDPHGSSLAAGAKDWSLQAALPSRLCWRTSTQRHRVSPVDAVHVSCVLLLCKTQALHLISVLSLDMWCIFLVCKPNKVNKLILTNAVYSKLDSLATELHWCLESKGIFDGTVFLPSV